MKVHPYLTVIQGQRTSGPRKPAKAQEEKPFSLENTAAATTVSPDVVEMVSLENKRAQDSPKDLSGAEAVLNQVKIRMETMSRSDLAKVHRLEGLVHVYTP